MYFPPEPYSLLIVIVYLVDLDFCSSASIFVVYSFLIFMHSILTKIIVTITEPISAIGPAQSIVFNASLLFPPIVLNVTSPSISTPGTNKITSLISDKIIALYGLSIDCKNIQLDF